MKIMPHDQKHTFRTIGYRKQGKSGKPLRRSSTGIYCPECCRMRPESQMIERIGYERQQLLTCKDCQLNGGQNKIAKTVSKIKKDSGVF